MSGESTVNHVAIIMDGNGRWAAERSHTRVWGHIRGSQLISEIVEEAENIGLKSLTMFAFSTENWSRPFGEVKVLFRLLKKYLKKERQRIITNKIRFKVIGDTSQFPEETKSMIKSLEAETADFDGLKLTFAFGYGGRQEIIEAANAYFEKNPGAKLTEEGLSQHLFDSEIGDIDLLIRTGGDFRISNFLLWQLAYAELYFTDLRWPSFSRKEFKKIIAEVSKRERRFGNVSAQPNLNSSVMMAKENKEKINLYQELD
jgi:undecaprenyl diphosphate synthase